MNLLKIFFILGTVNFLSGFCSSMENPSIKKEDFTKAESNFFFKGLASGAKELRDLKPVEEIFFSLRDPQGKMIGGIYGYSLYGSAVVDMFWIEKPFRLKGYGKELLKKFEIYSQKVGARFITLTTMDFWEAIRFYKSQGYNVEFTREGYDKNTKLYSLRKNLE